MRRSPAQRLRFTHIYLENWKNFRRVDVGLQERVFLVGPNASGKSNFLDVFRFLRDIVSIGGGFQQAVQDRYGVSRLRCLAARSSSDIVIQVRLGSDEEPAAWRYLLRFSQDAAGRPGIVEETVARSGKTILGRPDDNDKSDPERLTQTYLEQVYANQDFREVGEFFKSVHYLHIVPQLVREPDRSVGIQNDPYGGDFLEQIAKTPQRRRRCRLGQILKALRAAVPQLNELELARDDRGTPHLMGKYEHWRPRGAWQIEDQFSDGTLRLMGLLWSILEGAGPVLLEEPELSLHPELVRLIPQVFARLQRRSGRQVLLSTHSADLLTDEGIGLDEVLLLTPSQEGTEVRAAGEFQEIRALLEGGSSMAEAVIPRTRPPKLHQLAFAFGDKD